MKHRLAALAAFGLIAATASVALGKPTPIRIKTIRAPNPPHCMAAAQWTDAEGESPLNLFDGDPSKVWTLCKNASEEPDYAVEVRFEKPITLDQLRVVLATEKAPAKDRSLPTRLEVAFLRSDLSSTPIFFRTLELGPDQATMEMSLKGPLKWSPNLINDPQFGAKRQKLGYSEYDIPMPLETDGLVLVIRRKDGKPAPAQLAELQLWFEEARLPVKGLAKARKAHRAFIEQGLVTVLRDHYLVGKDRVLGFAPDGRLWAIAPATWATGMGFPAKGESPQLPKVAEGQPPLPPVKLLGPWRIEAGRVEVFHRRKYVPIRYLIDRAPRSVTLAGGGLDGEYEVKVAPPHSTATAQASPSLGGDDDPLGDPPLLDDPDEDEMIPIP